MGVKGFITSTAIQRCDEREAERLVGAVGGIYPFLDPKRKERSEVNDKTGIYGFPWPAVTPSAPDKFVAGFQSTNDNSGKKDLRIIPCTIKSAFLVGALTTGAFFTGAAIGIALKKTNLLNNLKKSQFKENKSASSK